MTAKKTEGGKPEKAAKPVQKGRALSEYEAKLMELASDPSMTGQAAILREVQRLHLDNIHLKRANWRAWGALGAALTAMTVGMSAQFWWFPKYRYVATLDNKAVCNLETQAVARQTDAAIEDFAKEAAIASYTFDYVNWRKTIADFTARYYNARGRSAYYSSLEASKNLDRVREGRLIMKAFATNAPQIEEIGREGDARVWWVYVPVTIEFYVGGSPAPTTAQQFTARVKVMAESPSAANTKGIAVDSIVLAPPKK